MNGSIISRNGIGHIVDATCHKNVFSSPAMTSSKTKTSNDVLEKEAEKKESVVCEGEKKRREGKCLCFRSTQMKRT